MTYQFSVHSAIITSQRMHCSQNIQSEMIVTISPKCVETNGPNVPEEAVKVAFAVNYELHPELFSINLAPWKRRVLLPGVKFNLIEKCGQCTGIPSSAVMPQCDHLRRILSFERNQGLPPWVGCASRRSNRFLAPHPKRCIRYSMVRLHSFISCDCGYWSLTVHTV